MNSKRIPVMVLLIATLINQPVFAQMPDGLIEVNASNRATCIEFYKKQGKLYCSTKKLQPKGNDAYHYDKAVLQFDGRPWVAAWGQNTAAITAVEYIVKGDSITRWKELVTSQFIPGANQRMPPQSAANFTISNLQKQGFHPNFKIIESSSTEVIFEFKIAQPVPMAQHEIQRIISTPKGFYIFHYVIKKPDMGSAMREKWINLLKQAKPKS